VQITTATEYEPGVPGGSGMQTVLLPHPVHSPDVPHVAV
jgi:hypothetical protein